jgi:hypothetical protein
MHCIFLSIIILLEDLPLHFMDYFFSFHFKFKPSHSFSLFSPSSLQLLNYVQVNIFPWRRLHIHIFLNLVRSLNNHLRNFTSLLLDNFLHFSRTNLKWVLYRFNVFVLAFVFFLLEGLLGMRILWSDNWFLQRIWVEVSMVLRRFWWISRFNHLRHWALHIGITSPFWL